MYFCYFEFVFWESIVFGEIIWVWELFIVELIWVGNCLSVLFFLLRGSLLDLFLDGDWLLWGRLMVRFEFLVEDFNFVSEYGIGDFVLCGFIVRGIRFFDFWEMGVVVRCLDIVGFFGIVGMGVLGILMVVEYFIVVFWRRLKLFILVVNCVFLDLRVFCIVCICKSNEIVSL